MFTIVGRLLILLLVVLAPVLVHAQQAVSKGQTNINSAMPVVCLNQTTFLPEGCGGAGGAGLTDAELRATPVPVSGTVTATGPLTDAQLRATPVPVSGTVTVTDGAGALNVIVDSLPTVTVTDGAGALNVIVDSLPTVTVTDGAGALNVIVDSGTTTVTQATATNLNAAVVGTGTAGAPAGNILTIQGVGSMTKLLVTPDSVALPANQSVNVNQIVGTAPAAHDGLMSGDSVPFTTACYSESPEDSDANTSGNRTSADADKGRVLCTRYGEVFIREGGVFKWTYHENSSAALTDTTVHASCGAGFFNYISAITFSTNAATGASVMIEDSTTTAILGPYYLEAIAGRGLHVLFPGGKKQTTAATLISVTTTGAIAHGLDIQGFCAP